MVAIVIVVYGENAVVSIVAVLSLQHGARVLCHVPCLPQRCFFDLFCPVENGQAALLFYHVHVILRLYPALFSPMNTGECGISPVFR